MTKDEYVASLKAAIISIGAKGLFGLLVSYAPGFGAGLLGKLSYYLIEKFCTLFVNLAEMEIFFVYIDLRTAKQGDEFTKAAEANRKAQESGTPDEKKAAEANLIAVFRDFAKLNR